jgi:hypothetical protein
MPIQIHFVDGHFLFSSDSLPKNLSLILKKLIDRLGSSLSVVMKPTNPFSNILVSNDFTLKLLLFL